MTALSSEQRVRHDELAVLLQSSLTAVHELANGYDFEFSWSPDTYNTLAEITPLEHACCPFFDIDIRIESGSNKLCWQIDGARGNQAVHPRGVWKVVRSKTLPLINADNTDRKKQKRTAETLRRGEIRDRKRGIP